MIDSEMVIQDLSDRLKLYQELAKQTADELNKTRVELEQERMTAQSYKQIIEGWKDLYKDFKELIENAGMRPATQGTGGDARDTANV
jgi:hypothetical protein